MYLTPCAPDSPLIRDISDTARWAAWCRAVESDRPDALFRDPHARVLAGGRGAAIEEAMSKGRGATVWSLVVRTLSFDTMIMERIAEGGIDTVVNVAAGLDTRPYRLPIPRELRWIEVDLPELVAFKDAALAGEPGACQIERVALDLSDADSRRKFFASIGDRSKGALVLSEGLLLYLDPESVTGLAEDLAGVPAFRTWFADLLHPAMLPFVIRSWNIEEARPANMPRFAPEGGAEFFRPYGWALHHWVSPWDVAQRVNRLPESAHAMTAAQREASRMMNTYVRLDRVKRQAQEPNLTPRSAANP